MIKLGYVSNTLKIKKHLKLWLIITIVILLLGKSESSVSLDALAGWNSIQLLHFVLRIENYNREQINRLRFGALFNVTVTATKIGNGFCWTQGVLDCNDKKPDRLVIRFTYILRPKGLRLSKRAVTVHAGAFKQNGSFSIDATYFIHENTLLHIN